MFAAEDESRRGYPANSGMSPWLREIYGMIFPRSHRNESIRGSAAAKEPAMRLELGATVRTAEGGEVGTIDQLVVDSERRTIAYFILRTGRFFNHDYIVPIDAIRAVDDDNTIHLI